MPCDDEPHSRARGVHHARTHANELARLTMTTTPPRDDDETLFTVADASGHFAADWGSEEEDVDVEADDDDYSEGADVAEEVDALDEDEIDEWVDADGADLGPGTPSPKKGGGGWDEDVHSGEEEDEAEAEAAEAAEEAEEEEEGEIQDLLTGAPLAKPAPPKKKKPTSTNAAPRCANAASSAAATKPGAGVAPEVRAWIADAATLRGKQKQLETATSSAASRARLPPDVEPIATHGAAAAEEDQDELRADLAARLKRVRSNVVGLGLHVANVTSGSEYVDRLATLMDDAEREIVGLKDAQRRAFDALLKEEKELTRYCEDFAQRVDDPTWEEEAAASTSAAATRRAGSKKPGTKPGPYVRPRRPATAKAGVEPWTRDATTTTPAKKRTVGGAASIAKRTPSVATSPFAVSPPSPSPGGGGTRPKTAAAVAARGGDRASLGPWAKSALSAASPPPAKTTRVLLDGTPVLDGLDDDDDARDGARGETAPKAVTDHDDYVEKFGPTGGWADVDHARWRRCLSRANMNYGAAVLLAAEELSAFGIERQEVIRHARWDAARDDLFEKKKEAVKKWRAKQREAAAAHRAKLDAEHDAKERLRATKASAELAAQRSREKEALREWKEKKRSEEENRKLCAAGERRGGGGGARGAAPVEEDRARGARCEKRVARASARRRRGEREDRRGEGCRGAHPERAADVASVGQGGARAAGEKGAPGAFYLTLVPIRPRSRGERRSLRTSLPASSLRPSPLAFDPDTPRRLSTPTDAFRLHPDVRSYGTTLRRRGIRRRWRGRRIKRWRSAKRDSWRRRGTLAAKRRMAEGKPARWRRTRGGSRARRIRTRAEWRRNAKTRGCSTRGRR